MKRRSISSRAGSVWGRPLALWLWLVALATLVATVSGAATPRLGQVRLPGGTVLVGEITWAEGGIVVKPATGDSQRVQLSELVDLRFDVVATPTTNSPAVTQSPPSSSPPALTNAPVAEAAPTNSPPSGAAVVPTGWTGAVVGLGAAGTITAPKGATNWQVSGSGSGLRGNADSVYFAERTMEVAGQVMARLDAFDGQDPEAVAGLMLRDNLGDSAAYGFAGLRTGSGLCFQYRQVASGMTMRVTNVVASLPVWLRLSRTGGGVVAEYSPDGEIWQVLGRGNINLGQRAVAGVVVAGGQTNLTSTVSLREPVVGARGLGYSPSTGYPRLWLRGGTRLIGSITSADDAVVRLGAPFAGGLVSVLNLARIEFVPLTSDLVARLEPERPGLLLVDGDFIDGPLRAMATNTVTINSLLFGFRRFPAGSEVAAVQFGELAPEEVGFHVELFNGSEILARTLTPGTEALRAEAPKLGALEVPFAEIRSLRRVELAP